MALQNHPALYSGGNVKLDPTPYVNIALRARAQKAAQDEAIDKYYQKIPETINDKGVRDQEIEVLNDMKNDIFKFGVDNREALRKGDGAARLALDKKFRKAQTYAQESKNRTATAAKISQLRANPKYDYIFRDKGFIEKVSGHDLPIDTEGSQAIDFNQLTLPPTPFEATKYFKGFADIKPDYKVSTKPNPDDKNTLIEVQTPVFNEQHKQAIYQRAASDLVDNPSFEEEMKKNLAADPNLIAKLYDTFKHNYGRDITDETKDIDLAAAYTLLGLGIAAEKQKVINNQEEDWKKKLAFNAITSAQADKRTSMNKANTQPNQGTSGNSFDEVDTEIITKTGIAGIGREIMSIKPGQKIRDANGSLFNGEVILKQEQVPANTATSMRALGAKVIGQTKAKIIDGVIVEMTPSNGSPYNRKSIENGQMKVNTENLKAPQMQFGNDVPKTESTPKKAILD